VNCNYCDKKSIKSIQLRVGEVDPDPEKDTSSHTVIGFCEDHWREVEHLLLHLEMNAKVNA
jgi:hypothetical protein